MQRVLIIEDDRTLSDPVRALVERLGYEVHQAFNSDEAAVALLGGRWGLVLSDVLVPNGADGMEVIRAASKLMPEPRPAVVFITGMSLTDGARRIARDMGVDVVLKPFRNAELAALVQKKLGAPRD